ncbi:hypothetical protein MNBD_BACTEROID05-812 [hydrothermal vent metagenome]|uniref:Polysaccharide biosynthesis protein C-terminal domain-containing protein n=1 Tax=hydrothermal vent metagenome TaxID=652676 RepID=A0A3B0TW88_9ZZZZ
MLMGPMKVGGIALASSIAGTVDFLILFYVMDKKLDHFDSELLKYFLKVTGLSLCMGIGCFFFWKHLSFSNEFLKLCIVGVGGFLMYGLGGVFLKIEQAQKVWGWIEKGIKAY